MDRCRGEGGETMPKIVECAKVDPSSGCKEVLRGRRVRKCSGRWVSMPRSTAAGGARHWLYLEGPTQDPRVAITTDEAKRIVTVMLRDVGRDKFVKSVEEGIQRNAGPVMPALRDRLDRGLKDKRLGR